MMDAIKLFLECVGIFFILYMIGYASFLFLAVSVGSSTLHKRNQHLLFVSYILHLYMDLMLN